MQSDHQSGSTAARIHSPTSQQPGTAGDPTAVQLHSPTPLQSDSAGRLRSPPPRAARMPAHTLAQTPPSTPAPTPGLTPALTAPAPAPTHTLVLTSTIAPVPTPVPMPPPTPARQTALATPLRTTGHLPCAYKPRSGASAYRAAPTPAQTPAQIPAPTLTLLCKLPEPDGYSNLNTQTCYRRCACYYRPHIGSSLPDATARLHGPASQPDLTVLLQQSASTVRLLSSPTPQADLSAVRTEPTQTAPAPTRAFAPAPAPAPIPARRQHGRQH